jgi:serine protease inhibitor
VEFAEKGNRAPSASKPEATQLPTVQVNRPFLFVVRRPASGLILLVGRVGDPASASAGAAPQ